LQGFYRCFGVRNRYKALKEKCRLSVFYYANSMETGNRNKILFDKFSKNQGNERDIYESVDL